MRIYACGTSAAIIIYRFLFCTFFVTCVLSATATTQCGNGANRTVQVAVRPKDQPLIITLGSDRAGLP
jgi:hypothetical protein